MRRISSIWFVALFLVAPAACKKDGGSKAAGEGTFRPASIADNQRKAGALDPPPMFAMIPEDTPFVFANFEPFPAETWSDVMSAVRPMVDRMLAELEASPPTGAADEAIARALAGEFKGKLDEKGLASFGLTVEPRFAFYMAGGALVGRWELADGALLRQSVLRIAGKVGVALPPPRRDGAIDYWLIEHDDASVLVAVLDKELVAALASREDMPALVPAILGNARPAASMKDGGALKKLAKDYGFTPYGLGYIDWSRLLAFVAKEAAGMPAACRTELAAVVERVPRLVVGYDEVKPTSMSFTAILELEPALAKRVMALRGGVPGMSPRMKKTPLVAVGVAADVNKVLAAAKDLGPELERIGKACEMDGLVDGGRDMTTPTPLPPAFAGLRGAMVVLQDVALGENNIPTSVNGHAVLVSAKPGDIVQFVEQMTGQKLGIVADGKPHKLALPIPIPVAIHAAIGKYALVVAAGSQGETRIKEALDSAGDASPLAMFVYDLDRLMSVIRTLEPADASDLPALRELTKRPFGTIAMWFYASERGLGLSFATSSPTRAK